MEVWKFGVLMILVCCGLVLLAFWCADRIETEAAVVTGDEPLGGMSKVIDDYYNAGGNMDDVYTFLLARKYRITETDLAILERIVEAEATDGTLKQKMNVASCILSRVESKEFPNTVESVVYQTGQFSPLRDGRYYTVEVTESTRLAVRTVLNEGKLHSYLYFCADCDSYRYGWFSTLKEFYFDGIHHYFTGEKK